MSQAVALRPRAETLRYDEMCRAITAAYEVDEVKDIRDKALAIEIYAKQAKNTDAERQACEIRLRAERKAGQLLRAMEKQHGARGTGSNQHQQVESHDATPPPLADLGISRNQSSQWQKLAAVPDPEFEQALKGDRPTTTGIIAAHAEPKRDAVDMAALWLWGRLQDFERDGLLSSQPPAILTTMLPHMQETTKRLAPLVAAWLQRIAP